MLHRVQDSVVADAGWPDVVGATKHDGTVPRIVGEQVEGSGLTFADRGEHELKGIEGRRRVYSAA